MRPFESLRDTCAVLYAPLGQSLRRRLCHRSVCLSGALAPERMYRRSSCLGAHVTEVMSTSALHIADSELQ